jgi:uncharacterized membrane protein YeaQ/YmgE (transglycosylase-associated protein family)
MSFLSFLLLLLIAAVCGGIGQALVGYSVGGCLTSIVVGLIGAYLGTWLATELKLPEVMTIVIGNERFPLLWAIVGSALFAGILGVINRLIRGNRNGPYDNGAI